MPRPVRQPFRIYRVGGSVRDELLGRKDADRDWVVVGATPETMTASGFKAVGSDFPVFLHPETREEYALARTERKHGRGYRGFEFFASPEVTLAEDLARRDLTINAMARGEDGRLIDPHGGEADLRAGILRHVSPAFVEDPLRVLRVARFGARFGFAVAPATRKLMRQVVASGELATLAPERVWQELARGLMEAQPARMLAVLRQSGAAAALLPEVDAMFGDARGLRMLRALDRAAARGAALPVRYAILAQDLAARDDRSDIRSSRAVAARTRARRADALSARLRVPAGCRDAARLAARWLPVFDDVERSPPARTLAVLQATDALRRPERLPLLLEARAAFAAGDYAPAARWVEALRIARGVDAGAAARTITAAPGGVDSADIAHAVRAARLAALRAWKRSTR